MLKVIKWSFRILIFFLVAALLLDWRFRGISSRQYAQDLAWKVAGVVWKEAKSLKGKNIEDLAPKSIPSIPEMKQSFENLKDKFSESEESKKKNSESKKSTPSNKKEDSKNKTEKDPSPKENVSTEDREKLKKLFEEKKK